VLLRQLNGPRISSIKKHERMFIADGQIKSPVVSKYSPLQTAGTKRQSAKGTAQPLKHIQQ
jgi:hypothetical protein